ncbi:MAG: hypothetical protein WCW46_02325 [Candidatus Paceibacterota bacterium]|jgi:hypothetical protein
MYTPQQKRDIYKKLPQKIRDIIASPEIDEFIDDITQRNNLDQKQHDTLAKAVVDFLMEINSKEVLQRIITNEISVDNILSQKLSSEVESEILNNLDNIYQKINANNDNESESEEKPQKSPEQTNIQTQIKPTEPKERRVGDSFEQIILNQARAMQPAKQADGGIMNYESRSMNGKEEKPANLPVENTGSKVIHNYIGESDPYRESIN